MLEKQQIELPPTSAINGVDIPYYLVGDAAFPLKPYLMTPYNGRELPPDKALHNKQLSRGRCCIENAFGILSARWQLFLSTIKVTPEHADNIIMAAVCMHNYAMTSDHTRYANERFVAGEWREIVANANQLQTLPPRMRLGARNPAAEAIKIRDKVKDILSHNT